MTKLVALGNSHYLLAKDHWQCYQEKQKYSNSDNKNSSISFRQDIPRPVDN